MRANYDSIDLMKFVAAIFVVCLHSDPLADVSPFANRLLIGMGRLAVPLFFVATSFFFFKSASFDRNSVHKYLRRMGLLYLAWFIVELPITVFHRFDPAHSVLTNIAVFIKNFFFTSTFSGSWFLASCIFCALLFYFFYKWFPSRAKNIIIVLSIITYLLCVGTSSWGNLMDELGLRSTYESIVCFFAKPYTSILVGVPYFAIGKHIAEHENSISTPNVFLWLSMLTLMFVEVIYTYIHQLTNSTDCYLMLLPCAYCVFVAILKCDAIIKNAVWMRKASTIVFFSQFIWLFMIEFAEWALQITIPSYGKFLLALLLCLLTAAIMLHIQKKPHFRWLRYFY